MTRRRARGRARLRPLPRRRRRRHPLPHLPGTHASKGAYFTRGTTRDAYARYSEAGPDYLYNVTRLLKKFETAKDAGAAAGADAGGARPTRFGVIYFGSTSPAMDEAFDRPAGRGRARRPAAGARLPVQRRGRPLRRRARDGVRRRAEPRRPAAHDADQRAGDRPGQARADPALRRHADHRALHHRGHRQAGAGRQRRADPRQERQEEGAVA